MAAGEDAGPLLDSVDLRADVREAIQGVQSRRFEDKEVGSGYPLPVTLASDKPAPRCALA